MKISSIPLDINTDQPAPVTVGSAVIPIAVESGDAKLVITGHSAPSPLIIEGSLAELFTLEIYNKTSGSLNLVELKSALIEIKDKFNNPVLPDQVVIPEESGFFENDELVSMGQVVIKRLIFGFSDFILEPRETRIITFKGKFRESISLKELKISIDSRDIRAEFTSGPQCGRPVPVTGEFGEDFTIGANYVVTPPSFAGSIIARKNPFNPNMEPAEISYYLERAVTIDMTIYTLTGEKVYEHTFPSGSPGGMAGENLIYWYGKNGEDIMVLNGVYILLLKNTDTGKSYRFKLAVMK